MTTPEFSRPVAIDTIGDGARTVSIDAGDNERAALARRFGLKSIDSLAAQFSILRRNGFPFAEGRVTADVVQSCVVTDEPIAAHVDERVAIRFIPESETAGGEEEIELEADDCDTIFYTGGAIDLGEAAAETMALALDPFPRGPNADAALKAAGVLSEGEAGPFGALAALRDKLSGEKG